MLIGVHYDDMHIAIVDSRIEGFVPRQIAIQIGIMEGDKAIAREYLSMAFVEETTEPDIDDLTDEHGRLKVGDVVLPAPVARVVCENVWLVFQYQKDVLFSAIERIFPGALEILRRIEKAAEGRATEAEWQAALENQTKLLVHESPRAAAYACLWVVARRSLRRGLVESAGRALDRISKLLEGVDPEDVLEDFEELAM